MKLDDESWQPQRGNVVDRTNIINFLIERNGYMRYLEIGVRNPAENFDQIRAPFKDGVDPQPRQWCRYQMTSDEFFARIDGSNVRYDIIFIDGLHTGEQVSRDILNALRHLSSDGTIVLHDCNPPTEYHQREFYEGEGAWNGTTWKAFASLRMTRSDLFMCTVDTDWGVGIVIRGGQRLHPGQSETALGYSFLEKNRAQLLNLVSYSEFCTLLDQRYPRVERPLSSRMSTLVSRPLWAARRGLELLMRRSHARRSAGQ